MSERRSQKLSEERRQAILSVAMEEFAACGFEKASYNRIIERCGLSKGVMYYYFDNKEDLYVEVLNGVMLGMMDVFGEGELEGIEGEDEFWGGFYGMTLELYEYLGKNPQVASLLRGFATRGAGLKRHEAYAEIERSSFLWLEKMLMLGREIGVVRLDVPFELLLVMVQGTIQATDRWLFSRFEDMEPGALSELLNQVFDVLFGMLGPSSAGEGVRPWVSEADKDAVC